MDSAWLMRDTYLFSNPKLAVLVKSAPLAHGFIIKNERLLRHREAYI